MTLRNKIFAHILYVLIAFVMATLVELAYGKFQHDRYWHRTIFRVQQTQVEYLTQTLELINKNASKFNIKIEDFERLLKPLDKKTPVRIYQNDKQIYSNTIEDRVVVEEKTIQIQTFTINFGIYKGPNWILGEKARFYRWWESLFTKPSRLFDDSYIIITIPYLFFFIIFYLSILLFAFWSRASYLTKEVIPSLNYLKELSLNKTNQD